MNCYKQYERPVKGFYRLCCSAIVILFLLFVNPVMAEYAYYCPYFSNSISKGEVIGLALTNAENQTAQARISIYDQNGEPLKVESWELGPFCQKAAVLGAELTETEGSFQLFCDRRLHGVIYDK
ncbi:MAG: hypothetical protein JXR80_10285 [Deltaproteobacteria bacterium]|nr:hypothetical protein [Deltaproteobacteria bacterium]